MITFIQCEKAREDLSIPEFREHWRVYATRAQAVAAATGATGLFMNTTLAVEENLAVQMTRGTSEPFDGVLKICWPNASGLEERLRDPEVAHLVEELRRHQDIFMDIERSSFFFSSEEALIDGGS